MSYSLDILNNIRLNASDEYQLRIPEATRDNIQTIGNAFSTYKVLYNEFKECLINKIGKTIIETKMFKNKLAKYKMEGLSSGQDVEEIFIEMAKAEGNYNPQGPNPLGRRELPDVKVIYHRQNRQDYYAISIGDIDFRRVFKSTASLDVFIKGLINSVYTADEYDEYLAMKNVLATYGFEGTFKKATAYNKETAYYRKGDENGENAETYFYMGKITEEEYNEISANAYTVDTYKTGYFDYEVPTIPTAGDAKKFAVSFIKTLRKAVQDVSFFTTLYNKAGVKTKCDPSQLTLFIHKDVIVECDVEQLATAFNKSDTDIKVVPDIVVLDDFGSLPNTYALLVDSDFFRVFDTLFEMETQRNAQGLFTNYFLHHHQILSASTFKNAVRFKAV